MISESLVFKKGEKGSKNGGFLTQVFSKFWTGQKTKSRESRRNLCGDSAVRIGFTPHRPIPATTVPEIGDMICAVQRE